MPGTYVNNAFNRRAGRVGLPKGSAVISSSGFSSGGSSFSGSSSGRTYVDNSFNRSVGRVGLPMGSAVISSSGFSSGGSSFSGSSSGRTYVDNAFNRSVGRVGLPMGSAVISSSSRNSGESSLSGSSSGRTYVDNSFNRSVGRVGLPMGSAVISSSSRNSGESSLSGYSSGRTYVDNSFNRSVGRVGLPMGSAVISSSSRNSGESSLSGSSSGRTYVDNSFNRSVGRVGLPMGSAVISSSSRNSGESSLLGSSSGRTYVDNSFNRSVGRVGLPMGSAVISSSSRNSGESSLLGSSSGRTYVDNSFNRSVGRVGLPMGSAVISSSSRNSGESSLLGSSSGRTYVDNSFNRSVGRVGLPMGSAVISSSSRNSGGSSALHPTSNTLYSPQPSQKAGMKLYVDNAMNRRLGRVGLPVGSHVSRLGDSALGPTTYVDNEMNRKLGRVGLPLGSSALTASLPKRPQSHGMHEAWRQGSNFGNHPKLLQDVFEHLTCRPDEEFDFPRNYGNISEQDHFAAIDQVLDFFARVMEIKKWRKESKCPHEPKTSKKVLADFSGPIIRYEDIELRSIIGRGGFGDVHLAKYQGTIIAVKKLRVQRVAKKRLDVFTVELFVLCTLKHKNIVRFIGACVVTPNLCICMEFMKSSLHEALHMEAIPFTENEKLDIIIQIGTGLTYLHEKKVVHCDVKSHNVLLDYEPKVQTTAKLTDFGLSMMKNDAESSSSSMKVHGNRGTPRYSAPEVLRGERLHHHQWKQADVYSVSLVFYEVACDIEPFEGLSLLQLIKQVGEKSLKPEIPDKVDLDPDFDRQLKKCWSRKAENRPSVSELVSAIRSADNVYCL